MGGLQPWHWVIVIAVFVLLFGAKNIERIGDHTTNIAEVVHYLVHGVSITDDRPKDDQTSSTIISHQ